MGQRRPDLSALRPGRMCQCVHGKSHRPGVYKCKGCEKQFTVTVETLFERSHIPLNKWLLAIHLMTASKKGVSALQLSRMLGLGYKSAWFMCMRVREGMREANFAGPLGGQNKVVEADESYVGGKETNKHLSKRQRGQQGGKGKEPVFSLVERDGKVRSFHLPDVTAKNLGAVLHAQIDRKSYLMTDDAPQYVKIGDVFAGHAAVNHSAEEYVRLGGFVHTNTVEGFFDHEALDLRDAPPYQPTAPCPLSRGARFHLQQSRKARRG